MLFRSQSVDIRHLGKYLRKSKEKYIRVVNQQVEDEATRESLVKVLLQEELEAGVQTIQYQINTLMTTNGQSPFVTLFLNIEEEDDYALEVSEIVKEILRQRLQGIKNEKGVFISEERRVGKECTTCCRSLWSLFH